MTINAISIIPAKTASCPAMGDAAIKKKMAVQWAKRKKGDIVLFDFNHNGTSDHIGIIVAVNSDGSIDTVEGNTGSGSNTNGGQVQKRTRYKSQVNFIVRPKYTKTITPDMVVNTAKSQVGIKESPKNSNKVKYNVWFYGSNSSAQWCATFVCWCFAHILEPVKPVKKPAGKYSGTIPSGTLKNGSKGSKVNRLQKFLNWYYPAWKLTVDGSYGDKTTAAVRAFQVTEGLSSDGVYGPKSYARAKTYKKAVKPTTKPATKPTGPQPSEKALKAVAWAKKIAASKAYTYKKWNNKNKKTKQCPICHKLTGKYKGWNCIGFVSAAWYHGAGLKKIECSCKGIGTDSFFTKVTLASWTKRNGPGWTMITNGGGKGGADIPASKLIPGDVVICYDSKGKFHHVVLYIGDSKYIDCTNTSSNHIAARPYSHICGKYHVTRAFRYTGK